MKNEIVYCLNLNCLSESATLKNFNMYKEVVLVMCDKCKHNLARYK